jgi:hypothetical protein
MRTKIIAPVFASALLLGLALPALPAAAHEGRHTSCAQLVRKAMADNFLGVGPGPNGQGLAGRTVAATASVIPGAIGAGADLAHDLYCEPAS